MKKEGRLLLKLAVRLTAVFDTTQAFCNWCVTELLDRDTYQKGVTRLRDELMIIEGLSTSFSPTAGSLALGLRKNVLTNPTNGISILASCLVFAGQSPLPTKGDLLWARNQVKSSLSLQIRSAS
jgi:hypothetical protein